MNNPKFPYSVIPVAILIILSGCSKSVILQSRYLPDNAPAAPDYAKAAYWAALPTVKDAADSVPFKSGQKDGQALAKADVFFIHPTIYTQQPEFGTFEWNADVNDAALNQRVDNSTILNQATAFNGSCKVYAPRYRQAHYYSFVTQNQAESEKAMNLAYLDIKAAFEYYLKNYQNDRPIVIASHSQGTAHAKRLLKEFFDGKSLRKKLVFAYLVGDITGIPVQPDEFKTIKPAQTPDESGGFAAWHTYARDFFPAKYTSNHFATCVCTNPLTWTLTEDYASQTLNKGGVGLKFAFIPHLADAQVHQGLLWINKPYVKGRSLLRNKVWHTADINLFWQSIRENVALRIENYIQQEQK
ncbi:DUF3089 domain-containing protein [Runella sp.]|uniref:DUF3089 domain-containing protein n=1 Tax=Runella sp. TaxID=1960881 RepID=UPI003D0F6AA6